MDPLISLEQLKLATGDFTDPSAPSPKDARLMAAILSASALVRNYTGLRFEVSTGSTAEVREFEYDGSGYLNIDEATIISGITTRGSYTGAVTYNLSTDEWDAYPLNLPVKMWLRLPEGYIGRGISPAMGFTYNLDTYGYRDTVRPHLISVTAAWGWPEIPYDVQQAVIWTAMSISETAKPYTQESIEGYSRTRGAGTEIDAIPERAQAALAPYVVPQV